MRIMAAKTELPTVAASISSRDLNCSPEKVTSLGIITKEYPFHIDRILLLIILIFSKCVNMSRILVTMVRISNRKNRMISPGMFWTKNFEKPYCASTGIPSAEDETPDLIRLKTSTGELKSYV